MNSNVTLTNSSQFYLANAEIFLRSIPTQIKFGELSDDALRLLVYYISKAGPFELAVESGYFKGTLDEWLTSLKSNLQFRAVVDTYADLITVEGVVQGDLVFVKSNNMAYIYDGGAFTDEANGISITGPSAYDIAVTNGFQGTVQDFLDSLKGEDGDDGLPGVDGSHGLSAYELAVELGFEGDEATWILSLKGDKGDKGETGNDGEKGDAYKELTYSLYTHNHTGFSVTEASDIVKKLNKLYKYLWPLSALYIKYKYQNAHK